MRSIVDEWVEKAPLEEKVFRRVIRIIIKAISLDKELSETMVLKGGILVGIRYSGDRHTTDIDFSCPSQMKLDTQVTLREKLNSLLKQAQIELSENIVCAVQKLDKQPPRDDATFPSISMSIGYADSQKPAEIKRLERGQSPKTVCIDYSFNEFTGETEEISINPEYQESIKIYSLCSLISEKYRSLLQQPVRNRERRQDVYDIYHFLLLEKETYCKKDKILELLIKKSKDKGIDEYLHKDALDDNLIKEKSLHGFDNLKIETAKNLPDKETAYKTVNDFFKSLPWENLL